MNPFQRVAVLALCTVFAVACNKQQSAQEQKPEAQAQADQGLQSDAQKFGYAIGVDLGHSLKPVKDDIDVAALKQGLDETLAGQPSRMSDEEREKIKSEVAAKFHERQVAERKAAGEKNNAEGEKFLADNAKRAGVKTTASGLQYEVEKEGDGPMPAAADKVTVNYRGTLLDGTEFDSSYSRGQPVTFPLGNVIPGWTEGLQLMKSGSKYKFFIPPNLAYGENGAGGKIGPNQTLVFEVELLSVEKAPAKTEAPKPAPKKK